MSSDFSNRSAPGSAGPGGLGHGGSGTGNARAGSGTVSSAGSDTGNARASSDGWAVLVVLAGTAVAVGLGGVAGCGSAFDSGGSSSDGGGGGGATTTTTATSSSGTGTTTDPGNAMGCSDGEREGLESAPDIAACAGGFSEPNLTLPAACARLAGDDGNNAIGSGCRAADLCAAGWQVCASAEEVGNRLDDVTSCALLAGGFFATQASTSTEGRCETGTTFGIAGCGDLGEPLSDASCLPLTRALVPATCDASSLWMCEAGSPVTSAYKRDSAEGGVLCCR